MAVELPQFKSCCFCIPLRSGLLTWGYFKMIADVVILPPLVYFAFLFLVVTLMYNDIEFFTYVLIAVTTIIAIIANFVATLMFVIGCHQKKVKRIREFYVYSKWELVVMTVLIVVAVGITIRYWRADAAWGHLVIFTIYLLTVVLHAYFILLLRSEVIKLDDNFEISYVNNSAEAEHVMPCTEKKAAIEYV